jgi:sugar phosphate isomerase/epimerase
MKLGCSSWSYHAAFRGGRMTQMEWLRTCAEDLEVDGVELVDLHFPTTDPQYLRDVKKLCTDLQLTIAGIAVTNDFGPDERRALEAQKVRQWCDIAAYLGTPVVRVFAGWVPRPQETDEGRVIGLFRSVFGRKGPDVRRMWSDVAWALRQCADHASERGITLALQNNRRDGIVGTPWQIAQCVHDVGSPWLRVCLDPADIADQDGIDQAMRNVVQVHARLSDVREDGSDALVQWPVLIQALQTERYRGFVLLDYEGSEAPETAVPRATEYMRGILQLLSRRRQIASAADDRAPDEAVEAAYEPAVDGRDPEVMRQPQNIAR